MSQCLASVARRASAPTRVIKQYVSSDTKKPAITLPPHKMRALVSLYHQSDTFITSDNLSTRIDEAFTKQGYLTPVADFQSSISTLREQYVKMRRAPKFSEMDLEETYTSNKSSWINRRPRDRKVFEALYGVDFSDKVRAMPGLESLEESMSSGEQSEDGLPQSEDILKEIEEDIRLRA